MSTTPYADSRLAKYIDLRISQLHHKTQADIAHEAGFRNANFITMLKMGNAKLALDRVSAFAKALEDDPAMIMRLAIEQTHGPEMLKLITDNVAAVEKTTGRRIREYSAPQGNTPSWSAKPRATVSGVWSNFSTCESMPGSA